MSKSNIQNSSSGSCELSERVEVVVVGSDVHYPSRTNSDILWSTSPFFRVSSTANFRGATSLAYTGIDFEVDENGLVLEIAENEEKRNFFARLFSILRLNLRALGKRIGVVNCTPA